MPICIECCYPLHQLYTTHSKADDRELGKGVRLTQCPRCKRFADKYVEHDYVVLFIDLVLIKPQVYRHLLFNRLARDDDGFDPSIVRFGVLLLLFDVYLTWARIEKVVPRTSNTVLGQGGLSADGGSTSRDQISAMTPLTSPVLSGGGINSSSNILTSQPVIVQYLFFLLLCTLETVSFHLPIRLLTSYTNTQPLPDTSTLIPPVPPTGPATAASGPDLKPLGPPIRTNSSSSNKGILPRLRRTPTNRPFQSRRYAHPNRISTALLVSSCTKLFPILMVIWEYDLPSSASAVSWAVIINNIAAMDILLGCGYVRATLLAGLGAGCRWLVGSAMLASVGLGGHGARGGEDAWVGELLGFGMGSAGSGGLLEVGRRVGKLIGLG